MLMGNAESEPSALDYNMNLKPVKYGCHVVLNRENTSNAHFPGLCDYNKGAKEISFR